MKGLKFSLSVIIAALLLSCNSEPKLAYRHGAKDSVFNCNTTTAEQVTLINEAIYTFETDLLNNMSQSDPNPRLDRAYSVYVQRILNTPNKDHLKDIISKHAIDVFNALKETDVFVNSENGKLVFNQNSAFMNCVTDALPEGQMKQTVNALKKVGDLTPTMFTYAAQNQGTRAYLDNNVKAVTALGLYYSEFLEIDLTQVTPKDNSKNPDEVKIGPQPAPSSGNQ